MLRRSPKRAVRRLQAMVGNARGLADFGSTLRLVLENEVWGDLQSSQGRPFHSFAQFLTTRQPCGLGVDSVEKLQPFLDVLKADGRYDIYADVIAAVRRRPGAQRSNTADSDVCRRFYTPLSSSTSLDQLLPRLQEHPELFMRVCNGELTPHAAAAQLTRKANRENGRVLHERLRFGVVNLDKLRGLRAKAKLRCACAIFDALDDDTRCGLIANRLETRLGPGLAAQWRRPNGGSEPVKAHLPRILRIRDAPAYLGMDRNRFNREVRPCLTELPIGKQGIGFDRLELDAWVDDYKTRNGRPKRSKGVTSWDAEKYPVSPGELGRGISTNAASGGEFAKALARISSKKHNDG